MCTENGDTDTTLGMVTRTYQKGAKENEGDEVEVGKVTPTLSGIGVLVTGLLAETRQHDLMPGLSSGTPEKKGGAVRPTRVAQDGQHTQESAVTGAPSCGSLPWRSHTCVRSEYHMAALALDFQIDRLERTHYCHDPLHQQCPHRGECPGTCGAPEPTPTQASDLPAWDPVHHPTTITPSF